MGLGGLSFVPSEASNGGFGREVFGLFPERGLPFPVPAFPEFEEEFGLALSLEHPLALLGDGAYSLSHQGRPGRRQG